MICPLPLSTRNLRMAVLLTPVLHNETGMKILTTTPPAPAGKPHFAHARNPFLASLCRLSPDSCPQKTHEISKRTGQVIDNKREAETKRPTSGLPACLSLPQTPNPNSCINIFNPNRHLHFQNFGFTLRFLVMPLSFSDRIIITAPVAGLPVAGVSVVVTIPV
jgi:hypothetical protein